MPLPTTLETMMAAPSMGPRRLSNPGWGLANDASDEDAGGMYGTPVARHFRHCVRSCLSMGRSPNRTH